jgi:hypothetical protein
MVGSTNYISSQIKTLLGYEVDEWLASPEIWRQAVLPEDRDRAYTTIKKTLEHGKQSTENTG